MGLNANSALCWFPRIEQAGLPVPRSEFVAYDHMAAVGMFEDGSPYPAWADMLLEVCARIVKVGGPPAFIRTDLSSAKHSSPTAYRVDTLLPKGTGQGICDAIIDNEMKHMFGPSPQAIMVREWLNLEAPFVAFGGLPIAREWRLFASRKGVTAEYFYWPEEAIKFWRGSVETPDWRERLAELSQPPAELVALRGMAQRAATACAFADEEWSVDFAHDTAGKWWLIDMAIGKDSWRPDGT